MLSRFVFFVDCGRAEEGAEEGAEVVPFFTKRMQLAKLTCFVQKPPCRGGCRGGSFLHKMDANCTPNQFSCKNYGLYIYIYIYIIYN